jgi:hypothetical protein
MVISYNQNMTGACRNRDTDVEEHTLPTKHRIVNLIQTVRRYIQEYGMISVQVAETFNAIGLVQCRMHKNYHHAMQCHKEAMHILECLVNQHVVVSVAGVSEPTISATYVQLIATYMDIGTCYELQQNYNCALQSYQHVERLIVHAVQQQRLNHRVEIGTTTDKCVAVHGRTTIIQGGTVTTTTTNTATTIPTTVVRIPCIPRHIEFSCRRAIARLQRL